jgi:8-oxo-dGTP pyrophosphatase MutT (NUDIX family)
VAGASLDSVRQLQARIQDRARVLPPVGHVRLVLGEQVCGAMDPLLATAIACSVPGFYLRGGRLRMEEDRLDAHGRSQRLERAARWLVDVGYVGRWRDEELDVQPEGGGTVLGRIDRCAVRALGITTHSVRLNGYLADGRLLVARRAAHKRIDPGLWDNLAGGLVAAGEQFGEAIARETYEEAGLDISASPLQEGGHLRVCREVPDGLLCEVVHVFDLDLPPDVQTENRDGEVERFESWEIERVLAAIEQADFTVEAALATLDSLLRRPNLLA